MISIKERMDSDDLFVRLEVYEESGFLDTSYPSGISSYEIYNDPKNDEGTRQYILEEFQGVDNQINAFIMRMNKILCRNIAETDFYISREEGKTLEKENIQYKEVLKFKEDK